MTKKIKKKENIHNNNTSYVLIKNKNNTSYALQGALPNVEKNRVRESFI